MFNDQLLFLALLSPPFFPLHTIFVPSLLPLFSIKSYHARTECPTNLFLALGEKAEIERKQISKELKHLRVGGGSGTHIWL
jgi:hypothetical protein